MRKALGLLPVLLLCASYSFATPCVPIPIPGDNTKVLRDCIATAAASDKVVDIGGLFSITDQIIVTSGVKLRASGTYWGGEMDINFGQNYSNTDGSHAAFVLPDNSAIDGLTFFYPAQTKGKQLIEFPPTISVVGSFCRVVNSFFPNSYVGIDATVPHGKLNMENLEFGMYYRGIRDDQCYDIDKFHIIHGNPGMWATWKDDSDVIGWMMDNSALIEVSRIDWFWIDTVFAFGTKYGILINSSSHGSVGESQIIQVGCDACRYGIYADSGSGSPPWLLTISNYSGTAFDPVSGKGNGVSIYIHNAEGVTISDSNFWGVRNEGIYLENCNTVSLSNLNFLNGGWNTANNGSAAIRLVNCNSVSIFGGGGKSNNGSSVGISIEGGSDITIVGTKFRTPGPPVRIMAPASGITTFGNSGCVLDYSGDPTNRIDNSCDPAQIAPTPTPTRTPTPTATPIPTRNPTDPTPTPTPTPIPTRPVKTPGTPLM